LRNALSTVCTPEQIEAVGMDPGARAEVVAVSEYVALANALGA
jgi:16S rRNA A1518/A1519 N6-dimethyltransferase RsmA/KsgA/DIM1 with predicted DNA glycosylase/AP lyase activity